MGRQWWKFVVLAVAACLAVAELRGHLPSATSMWAALGQANPGWLLVAVVLEAVSMVAFAEQERRLLSAFGVAMRASTAVGITLARSAMATSLPGGSAIAAAYGFRQFRARGATRPIAAAVTLLCGVASVAGLVVVYAGDAVVRAGTPIAVGVVLAVLGVATLVSRRQAPSDRVRRGAGRPGSPAARSGLDRAQSPGETRRDGDRLSKRAGLNVLRISQTRLGVVPSPAGTRLLRERIREAVVVAAAVPVRRWMLVLTLAAVNWLTDLLCLLACLHALDLTVPVPAVGAAYLAAQLARQIPATAGGLGVIEAGLILAMTTLGAASAPATAAVLTYRLISCWSLLPLGAACWAAMRRPQPLTEFLASGTTPLAIAPPH